MAYQKKKNEEKVVAWFAPKRKTIKFDGDEDSLQIVDSVIEKIDFEKFPIVKGDIVEVGIKNDEVIFLKKVDVKKEKNEEKVETKNEVSPESNEESEIKTITIDAVRKDKTALKESNGTWPKISQNLQGNEAFQRGATVEVKMQGGVIVAVKKQTKVEEKVESKVIDKVEPEQKPVTNSTVKQAEAEKTTYKNTNESIEAQVSVKESGLIVRAMMEKHGIVREAEVIRLLKVYTKACYEAMQEV